MLCTNMISELRAVGHQLTDEQQVQSVIRSLPRSWEHMRVNLTYNESIKTFDDVARHVELEEEQLLSEPPTEEAFVAGLSSKKRSGLKRKRGNDGATSSAAVAASGSGKSKKRSKGHRDKVDMSKATCYNCNKVGHFARDCSEPKVLVSLSRSSLYVTSCCIIVETFPL